VLSTDSNDRKKRKPRFRNIGRKGGLVDQVVRAIEEQILDGRLPVGTRLPPEGEFAASLGVSRPVLREAVRTLVTKGLLDTRQGVGTTVRAVTHEEIATPLNLFLRTCGQEVNLEHLHQVRSILEVENAALAARQRTEADIADLARLCQEMKTAANDPEVFAARDSEFHRRLSETTHNPLLILLLDCTQKMMAEVRMLVSLRQPHLFDRVMPTHIRVLECVLGRDPAGARAAMREHLEIALAIQRELILSQAAGQPPAPPS
jgi:GntR family transcriptional repressor for pyruvate dehydrogenase complex